MNKLELCIKKITQFNKEQDSMYHEIAKRHGMSDSAFWILYTICNFDEKWTQQLLVAECFFPKQTINSAITKLIKQDYICLKLIGKNKKIIKLTNKGKEYCANNVLPYIEAEKRAIAHFSDEERELFIKLLEKDIEYLKKEINVTTKQLFGAVYD